MTFKIAEKAQKLEHLIATYDQLRLLKPFEDFSYSSALYVANTTGVQDECRRRLNTEANGHRKMFLEEATRQIEREMVELSKQILDYTKQRASHPDKEPVMSGAIK